MKYKKIFPILLLLLSFNFYGQHENMKEKKEQIKALKVAFLTTELNLTTSEAEKFWPIYNLFDDKQFELRHQKMKSFMRRMNDGSLDQITEKESNSFLVQIEETEEELFFLRKKFVQNLREILPSVKILKLKKAEEDFNRKLLQQYRNKAHKK
ncbi:sensor of ECF-type sigma factor [Flavobacterium sp. GSP27]|uniref:sensor of ECF-type sigma factor n=1 Tax=unclassified Flavobacterium TaxID=196869 RepID=UPI000F833C91|nr:MULTISPECIES: sensor of ECF-type sigma factor [unclassified Flavobacterium]RTY82904.1 sensor of ECF-type sigma factor [Flavobacterium sp. LS1P28]RTY89045.1 sensor of ECF-type sigma factor [Flavobacterium sp. GSN2]RTZ05103.1 sensor of ECF-type sigma factor [Flavobacterium sp. GSP27]